MHTSDALPGSRESEPSNRVVSARRTSRQRSNGDNKGERHASVHRCVSADAHEIYEVAGSTIVVTLLILSPPIVLVGVILLTTGAIISKIFVLIAGLVTILSGVLVAAITAFVFVRMRGGGSGSRTQNGCNIPNAPGSSVRSRCGGARGASGLGNYYRVTMDLERSTNSADGSFRVEITEQPSSMVTFFSTADSDVQPLSTVKLKGSESSGSVNSAAPSIQDVEIKRNSFSSENG